MYINQGSTSMRSRPDMDSNLAQMASDAAVCPVWAKAYAYAPASVGVRFPLNFCLRSNSAIAPSGSLLG